MVKHNSTGRQALSNLFGETRRQVASRVRMLLAARAPNLSRKILGLADIGYLRAHFFVRLCHTEWHDASQKRSGLAPYNYAS